MAKYLSFKSFWVPVMSDQYFWQFCKNSWPNTAFHGPWTVGPPLMSSAVNVDFHQGFLNFISYFILRKSKILLHKNREIVGVCWYNTQAYMHMYFMQGTRALIPVQVHMSGSLRRIRRGPVKTRKIGKSR